MKFEVNVSNKVFYGVLIVVVVLLIGVGVYAVAPNPGHDGGQLDLTNVVTNIVTTGNIFGGVFDAGYLNVRPQNGGGIEGGEVWLQGSAGDPPAFLDNYDGTMRVVLGVGAGKVFQVWNGGIRTQGAYSTFNHEVIDTGADGRTYFKANGGDIIFESPNAVPIMRISSGGNLNLPGTLNLGGTSSYAVLDASSTPGGVSQAIGDKSVCFLTAMDIAGTTYYIDHFCKVQEVTDFNPNTRPNNWQLSAYMSDEAGASATIGCKAICF